MDAFWLSSQGWFVSVPLSHLWEAMTTDGISAAKRWQLTVPAGFLPQLPGAPLASGLETPLPPLFCSRVTQTHPRHTGYSVV